MANFYRLIVCLLLLVSSTSWALVPQVSVAAFSYGSLSSATEGDLCVAISLHFSPPPKAISGMTSAGGLCSFSSKAPGGYPQGNGYWYTSGTSLSCPSNSAASGTACACASGYQENTAKTACEPVPQLCDWAKNKVQMVQGTFFAERGKSLCVNGCGHVLRSDTGFATNSKRASATTPWFDERSMMDFVGTGAVCAADVGASTGDPTPSIYPPGEDATPPKDVCLKGQSGGTVNGLFVCLDASETVVNKPSTTTKDDGAVIKKDDVAKSVSCVGESCTTTTTTTTTNATKTTGAVTTSTASESSTQTKSDYCKSNATDIACRGAAGGAFSGKCGAVPACTGDAVMCAVAAATFATNCKLVESLTPDDVATARATAALNGSDGINTDLMKAAAATAPVSVGTFNTVGRGWSRSCPSDPVIDISFGSVRQWVMPLSRLCGPLGLLANAAVALTLLGSLVWVVGGKKS